MEAGLTPPQPKGRGRQRKELEFLTSEHSKCDGVKHVAVVHGLPVLLASEIRPEFGIMMRDDARDLFLARPAVAGREFLDGAWREGQHADVLTAAERSILYNGTAGVTWPLV